MNHAQRHYDTHLANFYTWMVGDFDAKQQYQQDFFIEHGLRVNKPARAVDLGSGHGLQSISLARLGYHVLAIDFSATLLIELRDRAESLPIICQEADMLDLREFVPVQSVDLICCMGDTLPHLETEEQVKQLFFDAYEVTVPAGHIVLSFRELANDPLHYPQFIPVRSDNERILTCILDFLPDRIKVTDLLYTFQDEKWVQTVSSYYKLRLSKEDVINWLKAIGWQIEDVSTAHGMTYIIAGR